MKLIKLDAVDSTNDFLKALASDSETGNFTIVTAENQTKGKGQRGAKWDSEAGKNLIVSILIKNMQIEYSHLFTLNVAVALSVFFALKEIEIPGLSIKWPNDILSGKKKIGGVLIENILKSDGTVSSIAGIGLNVNQINFDELPKASSLAAIKNTEFDKDALLLNIVDNLKEMTSDWQQNDIDLLWEKYNSLLFKRSIPMPFENREKMQFMGIIQGVTRTGKLRILLENDSIKEFDIKEIKMLF